MLWHNENQKHNSQHILGLRICKHKAVLTAYLQSHKIRISEVHYAMYTKY
jgi:hypothetical protein